MKLTKPTNRTAAYPVADFIINRWSPRAMSGEPITKQELGSLLEAARWAPSSYNNQPWRFIYAQRATPAWQTLFDLMVPANQVWAQQAAVLFVIVSKNTFDYNGKPSRTHSFDTGSAWENLALQACSMDLVAHGMEGFSYDRARIQLHIPDGYTVEAMCAVGRPAPKDVLPPEVQKNEVPSDRKKIDMFAFEGEFKER